MNTIKKGLANVIGFIAYVMLLGVRELFLLSEKILFGSLKVNESNTIPDPEVTWKVKTIRKKAKKKAKK